MFDNQPNTAPSLETLAASKPVWGWTPIGPKQVPSPGGGLPFDTKFNKFIQPMEMLRLYDAVAFANTRGWVFNTRQDIVFMTSDKEASDTFEVLTKRWRSWCQSKNIPFVATWVWERPSNTPLNLHIQLHLPAAFQASATKWANSSVRSLPIASHKFIAQATGNVIGQWERFRYVMKGLAPSDLSKHLGIVTIPQGPIPFKRIGRSKAIGKNAIGAALDKGEFGFLGSPNPFYVQPLEWWSDRWLELHHRIKLAEPSECKDAISRLF